jgi:hypothetical protein
VREEEEEKARERWAERSISHADKEVVWRREAAHCF